jgi:hypothetical protein
MSIQISQRASGQRNVTFNVWGFTQPEAEPFEIDLKVEGLKLSSLVWLIEEKMGIYLCKKRGEIWLPMESRNSIRFDHALPVGGVKLYLDPFANQELGQMRNRSFFLVLDFDR